jgi:hypothetical protein
MERGGGETNDRRIPETLEEAYELRDASTTPEEWGFYQEHVYRLRAQQYRARNIRVRESLRLREQRRVEALRSEDAHTHHTWWKRVLGRRK